MFACFTILDPLWQVSNLKELTKRPNVFYVIELKTVVYYSNIFISLWLYS
jgi:hypothetical protein